MLSIRDPVHGFIRLDSLEAALLDTRPVQRLRSIRQLGLTHLVFPGAEHSRFSHALGTLELAGRLYDALAEGSKGLLPEGRDAPERRLVRAAALLHDIGHAPFSHTAEELFEAGIDHEEMSRRLLSERDVAAAFAEHGDGLEPARLGRLLVGHGRDGAPLEGPDRLLSQIISGELDADKMDYLLRDSLYCGVRYGSYDLDRLLDTVVAIRDPATGAWGLGVSEGGVHALEALVLARYYMFTQVYFDVTTKVLELHLTRWLEHRDRRWPADPQAFLTHDDVSVTAELRRSDDPHALALASRDRFVLAFETDEHLSLEERQRFEALLPRLRRAFGADHVLESHSAKDPHRLGSGPVLVQRADSSTVPVEEASHFLRHLERIDRYRVYTRPELRREVGATLERWWTREE